MLTNPLPITGIGDPYVLRWDGVYYLYATSAPDGFRVWHSADLSQWSEPVYCYRPGPDSFGESCFWAPEVYGWDGKFYMYYTAQWKGHAEEALRIGLAVADNPLGPFRDVSAAPLFDLGYGVLDGHVFTDDDGQRYLYYSRAGANQIIDGKKEADIYVARLSRDGREVTGPHHRVLWASQPWERDPADDQYWNEGPFVLKHQGRYHMMYSANFYQSRRYGIGGAWADSPYGPFVKYPENPIVSYVEGRVSGPGHNSVTIAPDGQGLLCVYHVHTDYHHPSGDRQVCIDPLVFRDGHIAVLGPTLGSR